MSDEPLFTPDDIELLQRCVEGLKEANDGDLPNGLYFEDDETIFPDNISLKGRDFTRFKSLATRIQQWLDQQALYDALQETRSKLNWKTMHGLSISPLPRKGL